MFREILPFNIQPKYGLTTEKMSPNYSVGDTNLPEFSLQFCSNLHSPSGLNDL